MNLNNAEDEGQTLGWDVTLPERCDPLLSVDGATRLQHVVVFGGGAFLDWFYLQLEVQLPLIL